MSLFIHQFQLLSLSMVLYVLVKALGLYGVHLGVGVRLVRLVRLARLAGLGRGRMSINRIEIPPFFLHLQKFFDTPVHVRLCRSVHLRPWQVGGRFRHGRPLDVCLKRSLMGISLRIRLPCLSERQSPLLVLPLHLCADDHQTPLSALCAILCAGDCVLVFVVYRVIFGVGFWVGGEAGEGREVWGV